jgi:hypothetical protein
VSLSLILGALVKRIVSRRASKNLGSAALDMARPIG